MMDRILGLTALTILGGLALLFKGELITNSAAKLIIMTFVLIVSGIYSLIFFKGLTSAIISLCQMFKLVKFEHWIVKLIDTISRFSKSTKTLNAFFYGFIGQVMIIFCVYLLSRSLSLNIPIATFYVLIPVIQIVSILPSINGLGVREGAFVYFFKDLMAPEYAVALAILYLGLMIPISMVGGVIYMFYGKINKEEVAL